MASLAADIALRRVAVVTCNSRGFIRFTDMFYLNKLHITFIVDFFILKLIFSSS